MSFLEKIEKALKKEETKEKTYKVLDRKETLEELRNLIFNAKEQLILISPYIDLSGDLLGLLRASKAKKKIIIYRRGQYQIDWQELNAYGYKLCEVTNLHAKVYMSEKSIMLSSMNLTVSSNNNFEISTLFTNKADISEKESKAITQIIKYARPKN